MSLNLKSLLVFSVFSGTVTYEMLCLYNKLKRYTGHYTAEHKQLGFAKTFVKQTIILDQRSMVKYNHFTPAYFSMLETNTVVINQT